MIYFHFYEAFCLFDCQAISSVQLLSRNRLFATPWTAAHQASPSITNFQSLLKLMSTESMMPSNHLILCRPLLLSLQSFPASVSFQMSQLFTSGSQSIGASASASVFPINIQGWFPLGLTGLISLQSKGLSRVFSNTTVQKHHLFGVQLSLWSNSHPYTTTGKTIVLTIGTFVSKDVSLLFNILPWFFTAFLPRSRSLLISWLQSPSTLILKLKKIKSVTVSTFSPSIYHEMTGPDAMILVF